MEESKQETIKWAINSIQNYIKNNKLDTLTLEYHRGYMHGLQFSLRVVQESEGDNG